MSQRDTSTADRISGVASVQPSFVRSAGGASLAPLSPKLCALLGLPAMTDSERRAPTDLPWEQLLGRIFAADPLPLPAYEWPTTLNPEVPHASPRQEEAIRRALATPDLFLIQGVAGAGKSHVAGQILRHAARQGLRVLFLASTPAALEQALIPLLDGPEPTAVRYAETEAAAGSLPTCLQATTVRERLRYFQETTLGAGRRALAQHLADRQAQEALVGPLRELAELLNRQTLLTQATEQTQARLDRLPATVEEEPAPEELRSLWEELRQTRSRLDRQKTEAAQQLDRCRREEQSHREELDRLRPLLEAHQAGRWWTPNFWRARNLGDVQGQAATLEQSCRDLQATALRARQAEDQLAARLAEQTQTACAALARLRQTLEADRRRQQAEAATLRERWDAVVAGLPENLRPAEASLAAVEQSQQILTRQIQALTRTIAEAEEQQQELEHAGIGLAERLREAIPIVAGTLAGYDTDSLTTNEPSRFDLLLLEEADRVTEAELLRVGERAQRWVLIGEPCALADHDASPSRRNGRVGVPARLQPGIFQRLWNRLHDDPSARNVAWRQELDRLVCVLAGVPAEQERWIQPEPLVDHPEITLHIWSPPRQAPRLLEVEFPAGTPIEQAKAFVLRELEELPLQTRARGLTWEENSDSVIVHLGGDLPGRSIRVLLEEGITEVVHLLAGHWQTSRLEFARPIWSRDRAGAWLKARLGLGGHDRTFLLDRPHRASPALAGWLADLFDEGFRPAGVPTPCVEFVTVPSLSDDRPGRRQESPGGSAAVVTLAPRLKSLRGGAGVEINLAEPRRHDLIPRELCEVLPDHGLVNYLEAQACVRIVRELLDDAVAAEQILHWQKSHNSACARSANPCPPPTHSERMPGIAVLACHAAQVQLIRHLLESVPPGAIRVEVSLPEEMRHRECAVAILSLTRSHLHRAVSYAEHPTQLRLALTRPAQRLILLGDPGTLVRRSQYGEVVEPLDLTESVQEQQLTSRLVRYLQGHGLQQRAFTIRELAGL